MVQASRRSKDGQDAWVCVARIRGAHGVKGEVLIEPLTDTPAALKDFKVLHKGADGPLLQVKWGAPHKGCFRARLTGVETREEAQVWNGVEIFVPRSALKPLTGDDHYHADLLGMAVVDEAGVGLGIVTGIAHYGASEVLDIEGRDGKRAMLPFTKDAVLSIDSLARKMTIDSAFLA